ncbi:L,D-transpeptidase family protein [Sphingomonas sp. BN140010]|uniref:L,D-transpeptidase family protein n=1 Tax=Sphingomonas arvum TaxID=2992113 RepID=A0ABT3JII1_9SPHN|nr:L,D-transpeptidase family protein [Sphingomonas sp. BN140010]MCW3798550.1 L,D-transpeptidase family protein [Sphingomonas sp. BN140010]
MNKLAIALAASGLFALSVPTAALASEESAEARIEATSAADAARWDMLESFGPKALAPGQYLWADDLGEGPAKVVVSLGEQMAYVYRGDRLVGMTTISSGKEGKDTPTGIFSVLEKKPMHRSKKYDNAPMPFMQRIDNYGIALHAGHNPGEPASHGCIRLPSAFAAKLYKLTDVGTPVLIGA